MPDEFVLGKMRATKRPITLPAGDADGVKIQGVAKVDCRPPPGSTTEYLRPDDAKPLVIKRFLQEQEGKRLAILGPGSDAIAKLLAGLDIRRLDLSYNDPYRDLLKIVPCHTVEIFLRVTYEVYEIKVTAAADVTVDGTAYPAGDELATFRVAKPVQFRFETLTTFNPLCCDNRPERPPAERQSSWLPGDDALDFLDWKLDKYGLEPEYLRPKVVPPGSGRD
jgi:hypothetical protein